MILDRIHTRCHYYDPLELHYKLSEGERLLLLTECMRAQWEGDGFGAFIGNEIGHTAPALAQFYSFIGADEIADCIRLILCHIEGEFPKEIDDRRSLATRLERLPALDEVDGRFYRALKTDLLEKQIMDYVESHQSDFLDPPDELIAQLKTGEGIREHYLTDRDRKILDRTSKDGVAHMITGLKQIEGLAELSAMMAHGNTEAAAGKYREIFNCDEDEARSAIEQWKKRNL